MPIEFATIQKLKDALGNEHSAGRTIALVPTMGYLHEGHLELMRRAKQLADVCVVSIFVNPTQFGPNEDLSRYPRDLDRDRRLMKSVGVDYLFTPSVAEMYPEGYSTYVDVNGITETLCGKSRPGHFRGVATVVAKFFNIVQPDTALFGEKDFQQLAIIRKMSRELNMGIEIVGVPIVREPDGLAMSSRNSYLSPEERKAALALSKSLKLAQHLVDNGTTDSLSITRQLKDAIKTEPLAQLIELEYLEIINPETLVPVEAITPTVASIGALVAIAAKVGTTRLIDNAIIDARQANQN